MTDDNNDNDKPKQKHEKPILKTKKILNDMPKEIPEFICHFQSPKLS